MCFALHLPAQRHDVVQVMEAAARQAGATAAPAQASNPAPAASTHGFTPVQLNVLRAQILAFRRIKVLLLHTQQS